MLTEKHIIIREGTIKEDSLIAKHFYQMWLDIGVDESNIILKWENITLQFIKEARRDLFYKAFIAEIDNKVALVIYENTKKPIDCDVGVRNVGYKRLFEKWLAVILSTY